MPTYRFEGDITLHCVHSPGTWLPNRDNLYVIIEVFNTAKRTRLTEAIFPVLLHERFSFEKTFYSALSACNVVDMLEDDRVRIELRQITDVYCGGTLLAYFETNAKELFCPCPHMCLRTLPKNEITMLRTVDFPGISPRLEFTVCSAIKGQTTLRNAEHSSCCNDCVVPCRSLLSTPNYYRPTVNSALRCRYSEMTQPQSYICSDKANHNARFRTSEINTVRRPKTNCMFSRPRSASAKSSPNYTTLQNQSVTPLSGSYGTSMWDLRERNIRDAQDRSDRYWCLYRFWQTEAERRRSRLL